MDDLVAVGAYASAREGFERCLVVLAMGVPCWLVPEDGGTRHCLMVESVHANEARSQLNRFERENKGWPPPPLPVPPPASRGLFVTPLLWALTVTVVFGFQNRSPGVWEKWGELDGGKVFRHGEWWRPVTALFLHADAGHYLSNVFAGVFIFAAALTVFRIGRGWLLLAAAGVGGNVVVAKLHQAAADTSLGSSTAIFGAVGLLAGRAGRTAAQHAGARAGAQDWKVALVPLAVGLTVLGLYGAGGAEAGDGRVDVAAHAAGFAVGLILGFACRFENDAAPA
jgi:rhomboid protease GluP